LKWKTGYILTRVISYRKQEKMVDKITKEGTFADNTTDKILKQHQRQIIKLETKINE
jgi:hypothetical protein